MEKLSEKLNKVAPIVADDITISTAHQDGILMPRFKSCGTIRLIRNTLCQISHHTSVIKTIDIKRWGYPSTEIALIVGMPNERELCVSFGCG